MTMDVILILVMEAFDSKDEEEVDDEESSKEEGPVNVPSSWVSKIEISAKDFYTRCPSGKKVTLYKKAKHEKYCEYLHKDGLVSRISIAEDMEFKKILEVHELFKNRVDKLEQRIHYLSTGWISEKFSPGRPCCLKEHSYRGDERIMAFYSRARVDGLSKREQTGNEITETYKDRDDHLLLRSAVYGERVKKFEPRGNHSKPIIKMMERFDKGSSKTSEDTVAERNFLISEDIISLKYHLKNGRISASTRAFMKPENFSLEKPSKFQFSMDMTSAYQADPKDELPKDLKIYETFVDLLKSEKKCQSKINESEDETREILSERMKEEMNTVLLVSVYDTERNEKVKLRKKDLVEQQRQEELQKSEMEFDYLAPFLARMGNPASLTQNDAYKLREECLNDLKQRLIDRANLIQSRFEKETFNLQQRQISYQESEMAMTKEDEENYLSFCSKSMFRMHILELRLNRHKETAAQTYIQLDEKLRTDPRLTVLINN